MSTIERLAKMVQETTPDQWVSIFSELHEKNCELEQQLEAAERRNAELVEVCRMVSDELNVRTENGKRIFWADFTDHQIAMIDAALAHTQEKADAAE